MTMKSAMIEIYFYDDAKRELGQFGDILLTRQSAFKDIPLIHEFISYYFGGHTAFRDKGAGLYETTGLNIDFKTLTETISSPGYDSESKVLQSNILTQIIGLIQAQAHNTRLFIGRK